MATTTTHNLILCPDCGGRLVFPADSKPGDIASPACEGCGRVPETEDLQAITGEGQVLIAGRIDGPLLLVLRTVRECCDGTGWTGNPGERCATHYDPPGFGSTGNFY